jgi:CRISPR-associated exonuclease Cas4
MINYMLPNVSPPTIKLSEIVLYLKCPRKVYFISRQKEKKPFSGAYAGKLLIRELGYSFPDILAATRDREQISELLDGRLRELRDEIAHIYPAEFGSLGDTKTEEVFGEIDNILETISANLTECCDKYGKAEVLTSITPLETEPVLIHEKLNLAGIPAAIVCLGGERVPLLIKTGSGPENGIWKNDRIHLAASALLVGGDSGSPPEEGVVEYAASGQIRRVRIHAADRRKAIGVIRKIGKIKAGTMPERRESGLCETCEFAEKCLSKPTSLASRFF